jgi:GNAT superfamily N-acetyltransferase
VLWDVGDGFELDDDPGRIDLDVVWRYLAGRSYWGRGRSRDFVAESIERSHRVVGLYHGSAQIGFARVVSDGLTIAYLCDVFVLPSFQGRGLGQVLVREAVDGADLAGLRWVLHTEDAHDLYRKLGFAEPDRRAMERRVDGANGDGAR